MVIHCSAEVAVEHAEVNHFVESKLRVVAAPGLIFLSSSRTCHASSLASILMFALVIRIGAARNPMALKDTGPVGLYTSTEKTWILVFLKIHGVGLKSIETSQT